MTKLFSTRSLAPDGTAAILEAEHESNEFRLRSGTTSEDVATFAVASVVGGPAGSFELTLALNEAQEELIGQLGLIGFLPAGGARLAAVRVVVRPTEREAGHTSEHPYFALYFDWIISAAVAGGSKFRELEVTGGADAELTLTAGFSSIYPPALAMELGARALQVRLDLDFLAATTGWIPLPLIDGGSGSPFAMPGLFEWFRNLAGQSGGGEPADWSADLRLHATLPLGLRFRRSYLALVKTGGAYALEARATGLLLAWKGATVFTHEEASFLLTYADGTYTFKAALFSAQYPAPDASGTPPPWEGELPFGLLALKVEACRVTAGLVAVRKGNAPLRVCPELVVEIAGASLSSEIWNSGEPIWSARAARLHLRGLRVLTCAVEGGKLLFEDVAEGNWLNGYRDAHQPRVARLSGVGEDGRLDSQDSFPIEFLDGSFDRESHLFLLWKQDNGALFERLVEIVPGLASNRQRRAEPLLVGFELARFAGPAGRDLQARLEWRSAAAPAEAPSAPPPDPPSVASELKCSHLVDDTQVLNLPGEGGTPPQRIVDPELRLDLPLIEVALARPASRSLLFYCPAAGPPVMSLLHVYRKPAATPVQPILYAEIDCSLEDGGERELLPTSGHGEETPFIAMELGSTVETNALAVITWAQGERPQIMRAFERGTRGFQALIPPTLPNDDEEECTGCPEAPAPRPAPLALRPERFGSPPVANPGSGWALALQIAAERALKSFFPQAAGEDSLVKVAIEKICYHPEDACGSAFLPPLRITTALTIKLGLDGAGDDKVSGNAVFRFDPSDMSLKLVEGGVLDFELEVTVATPDWAKELEFPIEPEEHYYSKRISLFGLDAHFYRSKPEDGPESRKFLTLDLRGGRFAIGLAEGTQCILRYTDLGGGALTFNVAHFLLGPGGLDVEAELVPAPLKVKGLSNPFQLESAHLSMVGSRMRRLTVAGSGKMPEILSHAPVSVVLTLAQREAGGPIDLEELSCILENANEPIFTSGIRYRFEITALSLRYAREGAGGRHFFFEVSGSAQFEPEEGEFDGGLLENLKAARIEFTRAPLSDELTEHLVFIVELNEPVTFNVFDLFRMEIRSFGFAPKHLFPTPRPALIIGGQCEFADAGDVISAEIDFHRMYIGLPKPGKALPQVEFKHLRVEIRSADGFRIGGTVASYDEPERKGFGGDGFIAIPGFPQMGAAFTFLKLRSADGWKRAWFIALEASAISYQIPPLPIYLRQVGLGFGYRMTSVLLRQQPEDQTLPNLVDYLLAALEQHQTLARIESWVEDLEKSGERARWTVAMEAVLTLGTTQSDPFIYDPKKEKELRTIVLQMLAAMRSDLTLAAGAKLWFPVSYDDFLNDRLAMRQRPLAKGFIHYAPRQQRLLAYARKEKNAYYGDPDDSITQFVQTVLEPMPFECLALIEPSRVRGEIGWADRLVFPIRLGPLKLECRGGMLFAVEKGAAIYGLYFSARGEMSLSGGAGGGSLGLRLSAHVKVHFAARLMMARPLLSPISSHIYGQIGIEISILFSVEAWFKFKVGFVKVRLRIGFSIRLQVLVALEIGLASYTSMGFKGRATVMIGVFGRRLRASVAVGVNESGVDRARAKLQPYMDSLLEPGKVPPVPGSSPVAAAMLTAPSFPAAGVGAEALSEAVENFAFAVIPLRGGEPAPDGERAWLLWIMPTPSGDAFYPVPKTADPHAPAPSEIRWATITAIPSGDGTSLFALKDRAWTKSQGGKLDLHCAPEKVFAVETEGGVQLGPEEQLTLRKAIAGCYRPEEPAPQEPRFPNFPFDFNPMPDEPAPLVGVPADREVPTLEDDRVQQGPRHADPILDTSQEYDRALADAMAGVEDDLATASAAGEERLIKQAQGNQAFLLRSFQDEIDAYAAATAASASDRTHPHDSLEDASKPSVWDTGMVLLLKGARLPEWVRLRDSDDDMYERPALAFEPAALHTLPPPSLDLEPIVEPEAALLSGGNTAVAGAPVAHFDEDLLALSWKLDWSRGKPRVAPGIGCEVHDFLRHYRVDLFDLGGESRDSLIRRFVMPANLRTKRRTEAGAEEVELKPPYSFTIPTSEIFPEAGAGRQEPGRVLAVVTPIGQAGEEGDSFSVTAVQEPRLTPLTADGAELNLATPDGGGPLATLTWEEPALPNRAGIADTDEWQLILRRLPHVPLGHYPLTAEGDAGDESGQLAFDRALRPGDLILRMPKGAFVRRKPNEPPGQLRRRAEFRFEEGGLHYTLDLHDPIQPDRHDRSVRERMRWVDHEGRAVFEDDRSSDRLQQLVRSFCERKSVAEADGHAWQLFLRAGSSRSSDPADLPVTCSSIAPVRMHAELRAAAHGDPAATPPPTKVPLQHFEWPARIDRAALEAPRLVAGELHVPLARFGRGKADVAYRPAGERRRVVTATWSGFPKAEGDEHHTLAACAGFRLWERVEDGRTNQEVRDGVAATEIVVLDAADPALAAARPDTLSETQNWQSWSPAHNSMLSWLARMDDRVLVVPDPRRSWYSWSDADLVWPPPAWERPSDVPAPSHEEKSEAPLVRENLHPLLTELLLVMKRKWADPAGIVLEAAAGKPDTAASSPLEWMKRNTEALDPYGWAALWHFGLAVELSARDAVSGRPVPQSVLRGQCESILAGLVNGPGSVHGLAPHVMLDCPVRPNTALAGGPGSARLDDIALGRLQVALRPVVEKLEEYCVLTVPKTFRPPASDAAGPIAATVGEGSRLRLHWLGSDPDRRLPGAIDLDVADPAKAAEELKKLMAPGRELLLKFPKGNWSVLEPVLERIAAELPPGGGASAPAAWYWHVARPLSLGDPSRIPLWPHGQFPESSRSPSANFERFRAYLGASPLPATRSSGAATSRDRQPPVDQAEEEKIKEDYQAWARRFFAAAPLPADGGFDLRDGNVAIVAPRSEAVEILGPTLDGSYRFSRSYNGQWATARSLAVEGIGRYERLLNAMEGPPRVVAGAARTGPAFAPFYLSRVRKVEPPQLLGDRIVPADDGTGHHELTIAIHEEDRLAQSNVRLLRQLEFGGSRMRHRRDFRYRDWAEKVSKFVPAAPPKMSAPPLEWREVPRFTAGDESYLGDLPNARFGATAAIIRCEPFFYETWIEVQSLAGTARPAERPGGAAGAQVKSALVARPLAQPPAGEIRSRGASPLEVAVQDWESGLAEQYEQWIEAIGGADEPLRRALARSTLHVRVRYPRYFESLPESGDAVEGAAGTVGTLPDSEAAVHLTRRVDQGDEPICIVRVNREKDRDPFDLIQVSADVAALPSIELDESWSDGVRIGIVLRPDLGEEPGVPAPDGLVAARLPLSEPGNDALFAPAYLPAWGRLAGAAPLALRLLITPPEGAEPSTISMADPFPVERYMARPLSATGSRIAAEQGDLAVGIRLLLDPERMTAAKAAAYFGEAPLDLRRSIEEAAGVACRECPADGLPQGDWDAWKQHLAFWTLTQQSGGTLHWTRLDDPPAAGDRLIAFVADWNDAAAAAFEAFLMLERVPGAGALDASGIKAVDRMATALASRLEAQVEKSRKVGLDPASITAWVQRGNAARAHWAGREP